MVNLTNDERAQLAATFRCAETELDDRIGRYAEAASEEYLRMILGQRVFTRGQDIREYRLFLLVRTVFGNRLPSEADVSAHFQTTATQSRALLKAVMSKYQYELTTVLTSSLRDVLAGATQDPESSVWSITIDSESIIEALNRRLAGIDGTLPQISKARGTVTTYELANSSYLKLKDAI